MEKITREKAERIARNCAVSDMVILRGWNLHSGLEKEIEAFEMSFSSKMKYLEEFIESENPWKKFIESEMKAYGVYLVRVSQEWPDIVRWESGERYFVNMFTEKAIDYVPNWIMEIVDVPK